MYHTQYTDHQYTEYRVATISQPTDDLKVSTLINILCVQSTPPGRGTAGGRGWGGRGGGWTWWLRGWGDIEIVGACHMKHNWMILFI